MTIARPLITLSLVAFIAVGAACSSGGGGEEAGGKVGRMVLTIEGVELEFQLDAIDCYLTEREDRHPELIELHGPDVFLVGEHPMHVHVGYGADWEQARGAHVDIKAKGGPYDEGTSWLNLPWRDKMPVIGGHYVVEDLVDGYKYQGLKGTIQLTLEDGKVVEGTYVVGGITWG